VHPDGPFAREHLGTKFGKTEAWIVLDAEPGAQLHLGWRSDVHEGVLRGWVDAQDRDALLDALNPVPVSPGDALFVPAGQAHAIGEGVLIVELQEPTDMSILLEWHGYADDDDAATLGLGWDLALSSVDRAARDPESLRGPRPEEAIAELLPPAASPFFTAQFINTAGGELQLDAGFAVILVTNGTGELAGVEVQRGDALVVPHAVGTVVAEGRLEAIVCRPPRSNGG
jgi:mannose-6-phosphate isomerase